MELSKSKQKIKKRQQTVIAAYNKLTPGQSVSVLVAQLAEQFGVTEVTIYSDLKPVTKKI